MRFHSRSVPVRPDLPQWMMALGLWEQRTGLENKGRKPPAGSDGGSMASEFTLGATLFDELYDKHVAGSEVRWGEGYEGVGRVPSEKRPRPCPPRRPRTCGHWAPIPGALPEVALRKYFVCSLWLGPTPRCPRVPLPLPPPPG